MANGVVNLVITGMERRLQKLYVDTDKGNLIFGQLVLLAQLGNRFELLSALLPLLDRHDDRLDIKATLDEREVVTATDRTPR